MPWLLPIVHPATLLWLTYARLPIRHAQELLPLAVALGACAAVLSAAGGTASACLVVKCRVLELQVGSSDACVYKQLCAHVH